MAQFFFDRHNGSSTVEPFSELKYSTQDYYYKTAKDFRKPCDTGSLSDPITTAPDDYNPQSSRCGVDEYPTTSLLSTESGYMEQQNTKQNMINNCLCKYKKNVDTYVEKNNSEMTINGTTNDNAEKYSNLTIKNINLGIGIGIMMMYIYSTNK